MYQLDAPIKACSSVLRTDSINVSAWQHNFPTAKTASLLTGKLGGLGRIIEHVFLYKTSCRSPVNTSLMHPGDTTPFQSCWPVPRGKDGLVPSPGSRVKSWRKVAFRITTRLFLIQCCISFSEIIFFLVSMGHDLVESILAM